MKRSKLYAAAGSALLLSSAAFTASLSGGTAVAAGEQTARAGSAETRTFFTALNNSGVRGMAYTLSLHDALPIRKSVV